MSVFVTEIIDEEWGNSFELTGIGYGVLIAVMLLIFLLGCVISNTEGKKKSVRNSWCFLLRQWRLLW